MLCPKCNSIYEKDYTKCSDCQIDLIPIVTKEMIESNISKTGVDLIKYGINLFFVIVFQYILVVIAYEFFWVYKLHNGGEVYGTSIDIVNEIIWWLIIVETIISITMVFWGFRKKDIGKRG